MCCLLLQPEKGEEARAVGVLRNPGRPILVVSLFRVSHRSVTVVWPSAMSWPRIWCRTFVRATLVHGDSARQVQTTYVSANYFSFLGVAPVQGRGFLPEEEQPGQRPCRGPEPSFLAAAGRRSEARRRVCERQRHPLPSRRRGPGGFYGRHAQRPRPVAAAGELPDGGQVARGTKRLDARTAELSVGSTSWDDSSRT